MRLIITPPAAPLEIAVGFDAPLNTFFAQVIKIAPPEDDADDQTIFWIGMEENEIIETSDLCNRLAPFAVLSDEVVAQLAAARLAEAHNPTALQSQMLEIFRNAAEFKF